MRRWGWLVPLLVATVSLGGCLGGDDATTAADAEDAAADAAAGAARAPPAGREGALVAFEETNVTEEGEGGVDHRHDYWQGRDRVTLAELHAWMDFRTDGSLGALPLPPDALVYEGTGSVELTFSNPQRRACQPFLYSGGAPVCSDAATGTRVPDPEGGPHGLLLQLRHAATTTWIDVGEVSWTQPLTYVVADPKWTDMPHASNTLWAFRVASTDPMMSSLTFDVKIDIVRAEGEIPLWPGHPEFYAHGHERVVLEGEMTTRETGLSGIAGQSGEAELAEAVPEKLVSYGTRTLYVYANITNLQVLNPAEKPTGWFLQFHNASGRWRSTDWTHPDHPGDATEHVWVLKVDDSGMDSPYADGSRWGFRLRASFSDGVVLACSGCAAYEATYDLKVVATDLEAAAYDAE